MNEHIRMMYDEAQVAARIAELGRRQHLCCLWR